MTPEQFERAKRLFADAEGLSEQEQSVFLDRECADDPEVRTLVEKLLAQPTDSDDADELLRAISEAKGTVTVGSSPAPETERQIGPYRLLEKIGEGGMGEVWLAEQQEPVRRKVALKIIKRGMDTKQVVARFEAERQALAMMDHPCVAKVFDAGATPRGRPYFVMERVEGVPITEHCDRHLLTTGERLELFRQVCDGVQHAHQKAIIHRDIKPSNVLVSYSDGKALPKIIDFGVAKATAQRLTEKTLFTEMGMLIGTPEYMSPEQAEMTAQNIDTRTDVYSLGVMLYELLTGALPFESRELREAGYEGIRRKIREEQPSKPSTRLSTIGGERSTESARLRKTDVSTLHRQLKGDLDWITMRTLEKDRARRYGSPAELAADIERHLENQPVLAGPPSAAYRAQKFIKRHRLGVGVAAAAVVVLVAFAVTMTIQARSIARERDRANREAEAARETAEFLENIFEISDPDEARGSTVTARELLNRSAERIRSGEIEQEEVRARLLHTMGRVYIKLGLYDSAEPLLTESLTLRRALLGDDHPDTLFSMSGLAWLYYEQGRYDEAEPLMLEALETRKRVLGDEHPVTLASANDLAVDYMTLGRYDEAEQLHLETLETRKRVLGDEHPATLDSMHNLANMYTRRGRYDEAEQLHLETLEIRKRVLGDDHPRTLKSVSRVAALYKDQRRYDEAEPLILGNLEVRRRVLGDDHPDTLSSMSKLAWLYLDLGRYGEAEPLFVEVLETRKRVFGDKAPATLSAMNGVATVYASQGRYDEAELLYVEVLEARRRRLGEDHTSTLTSMNNLAVVYKKQGRYDEAEPLYLETLETRRRLLGDGHPETLRSVNNLANLYAKQGRFDEAEPLHLEALETRRRVLGDDHPDTLQSMHNLARLYKDTSRLDRARPLYLELLSHLERAAQAEDASTSAKNEYAWALLTCEPVDLRDPATALRFSLEANQSSGYASPSHLETLSLAYQLAGDMAKAVEIQKKAIALLSDGGQRRAYEQRLAELEKMMP